MKKLRLVIIIISVLVMAAVGALVAVHYGSGGEEIPTTDAASQAVMDEYLIEATNEISPERLNGVWISEERDGIYTADSKEFSASLAVLKKSIFDEVYIELGDDTEGVVTASERLSYAVSSVKALDKAVWVVLPVDTDAQKLTEYASAADGVIFIGCENADTEKLMLAASQVKELDKDKQTALMLCADYDMSGLDSEKIDRVQLLLSREGDAESLISALTLPDGIEAVCCLDITAVDGKLVMPSVPLANLYALRESTEITAVAFDSLKSTRTNLHNCFGAVKTYITSGIAPEIAFRPVAISGYSGQTVTVSGYTAQINIYGSYLFPFFVGSENIGSSANGNISTTVDLVPGENSFTVSQSGSTAEYKVQSSCSDEIVSYIAPADDIYVLPGESFSVVVIAHCNASVVIRMGMEEIEAKCEYGASGFTSFTAEIRAPKSEEEIKSLGSMNIIAFYGDCSKQYAGAKIHLAGTGTTAPTQSTAPIGTTLNAQNENPTILYDPYNSGQLSGGISYAGNLMCVVKEPYADTKPVSSSDNYSPACSPLVGGTMDYVVAESTGYNDDEGETEYYYDLASGKRIKRDMVDLVNINDPGDNSLEVISVLNGYGKLQITLKTDWRVPYNIDYPGQNYYYSYKKNYNVTSFNADTVKMTFYHTTSAKGDINVSGCDVLSSAVWSTSAANKTATLTLRLSNAGEYYGSSLEYDANGNMVITINRKPAAENGYVVVLDAGHGGAEPGAVGLDSTVQERYLNLAFAYQVKAELEKKGVTVYLTRTGNDKQKDTLSLEERKEITRRIKPDLYVSIHCNGSYNPDSIGTSTYYYEPFSYELASNIYGELLSVHKNTLYAGRQELYSSLADKVQFYPFSVTRIEDCPSTLIEVGYLTNDAECAMLAQPENQELFGKAIADGIYKTLTQ